MSPPLDIEDAPALLAYLRQNGRVQPEERPEVRVLAGGVSNRTVWVQRPNGEAWVLKQALEKLRVPVEWRSRPERIEREALGMEWLAQLAPPGAITPLVFADFAHHLLAMQAVPQPHENWKARLLAGHLEPDYLRQFGRLLGTIHRRATERREELMRLFDDRSFFHSLRLEPYYLYTATQVPGAASFLKALVDETNASRFTLVHGDYSPKNILLYDGRLILLDHEVIHFGDGAFDLGFSLTHLLSKAHHLAQHRAAFAAAAALYWQTYWQTVTATPLLRACLENPTQRRVGARGPQEIADHRSLCRPGPPTGRTSKHTLSASQWGAQYEARVVRHTLACLLARVAGRSCLEYLAPVERRRQAEAVLKLIAGLPRTARTVPDLIAGFLKALG